MKDSYSKSSALLASGVLLSGFLIAYSARAMTTDDATPKILAQAKPSVAVQSKSVDTGGPVEDDEYHIYSLVLTAQDYVDKHTALLVIRDQTSILAAPSLDLRKMKLSQQTIDDYVRKNRNSTSLAPQLKVPVKYQLVSASEIQTLFENPAIGWDQFYSRFSGTKGLVALSRVGFDSTRSQALLHVSIGCGLTCGNGQLISLSKRKEGWHIRSRMIRRLL
jgi:hypothetical protein